MDNVLSIAAAQDADPSVRSLAQSTLPISDKKTLLAICADGTILAVRYTSGQGLLHEIGKHTLLPAIAAMRERSPWAYLIVSGNLHASDTNQTQANNITTRWDWNAVQGALLSVQELGVALLHIRSESDLPKMINQLAKRDHAHVRIRTPKEPLFVTPGEEVLLSLPGIGEERCEQLLRYANGNVAVALHHLTDPDIDIPGIGPETRTKIRKALGLEDWAMLEYTSRPGPAGVHHHGSDNDSTSDRNATLAAA